MSFRSVFRSLQEVFPQVDLRILKAVAIEHSTDVDAAVEFILSEVLPSLSAPQEENLTCHDAREENLKSLEVERSSLGSSSSPSNSSLHPYPGQVVENFPGTNHTSLALHASSLRQEEAICDGSSVGFVAEAEKNIFPLEHHEHHDEATVRKTYETSLACEHVFVSDTVTGNNILIPPSGESVAHDYPLVIQDGKVRGQSWIHAEIEGPIQLEKSNLIVNSGSSVVSSLTQCEDSVMDCISPLLVDVQGSFGLDVPSAVSNTSQSFSAAYLEGNLGSDLLGLAAEKSSSPITACDRYGDEPICSEDTGAQSVNFDSIDIIDNEHSAMSVTTRSGHVVSIDFLEDFVSDCKGIKNTLVSAVESIMDLMKDVDLREKEANLAKDAASKAGLDILAKVEDLKEMLKHAKEANSMHAGEVYGEKSILATEARELQSRLLSLSAEREKSLAIIQEIRQTLKMRLDTAEEERIKAEWEKKENEEIAQKALVEQEDIMDRVVQESKKLQQEAEENSKLREFLMERGRLVDMLQGEISVVCEDVLGLKERVDGRMPLGRSSSSSQVLSSLASSTSSHMSTSPGKDPCSAELFENLATESQEILNTPQPSGSTKSSEKSIAVGGDCKSNSDDDWEYFDEEAELFH